MMTSHLKKLDNIVIHEDEVSLTSTEEYKQTYPKSPQELQFNYKQQIVWRNVFFFILLHLSGLYGFYQFLFVCSWKTFFWAFWFAVAANQGVTAGAHRLWAHRTYKAKLPLRIVLMIWQTISLQTYIYEWVRDHRVHHKFTETDADPHNSKRGLFYSHIGWLMLKRHRDVKIKGKSVDMSDVEADPVVRFQRKYYIILMIILSAIIPTIVPWYFWNEDIWVSFFVTMFRACVPLNGAFAVNSVSHKWGTKPYDGTIGAVDNGYFAFIAQGEAWHNYHHVFPWDYKAGEFGGYLRDHTTLLIDFFAKIGWAYDLKTVSPEMVEKRARRTGDGSRNSKSNESIVGKGVNDHQEHTNVWGWGDKDMDYEDIQDVRLHNRLKRG